MLNFLELLNAERNRYVQSIQDLSQQSATSGGDGIAQTIHVSAGTYVDLQLLPNNASSNIPVVEIADTIRPFVLNITLDFYTTIFQDRLLSMVMQQTTNCFTFS